MFKKIIKKILLICSFVLFNSFWFSYNVSLPQNVWDDIKTEGNINSSSNKDISDVFKLVNKYLWIMMGSISLWVLLYAWYLLLFSEWNQEQLKKTNKIIIWGIVWIFVSLFAGNIINLIINLF